MDPSQAKIIVDGLIKAFEYGKALGDCQPNPLTDQMDHAVYFPVSKVAQAAIDAAEENMRLAVAAFAEKEKKYRRIIRELAYYQTLHFTDDELLSRHLRFRGLDDDMIAEVIEQHEDRRQKDKMRSEP